MQKSKSRARKGFVSEYKHLTPLNNIFWQPNKLILICKCDIPPLFGIGLALDLDPERFNSMCIKVGRYPLFKVNRISPIFYYM